MKNWVKWGIAGAAACLVLMTISNIIVAMFILDVRRGFATAGNALKAADKEVQPQNDSEMSEQTAKLKRDFDEMERRLKSSTASKDEAEAPAPGTMDRPTYIGN